MWIRSSRRLAGCIAIELALAGVAAAAAFKAGTGNMPSARALALQDAHGSYAVIAQTDFRITQAIADFVAATVMSLTQLHPPAPLLPWGRIADRPAQPGD